MKRGGVPEGMPQRIKVLIAESGLDCKEIGRRIGINRKTIYAWKEGDTCMSALMLGRFASLMGVSTDYLVYGGKSHEQKNPRH